MTTFDGYSLSETSSGAAPVEESVVSASVAENHWSITGLSLHGAVASESGSTWTPIVLRSIAGRRNDASWYGDAETDEPVPSGHYRLRVAEDVRWIFLVPAGQQYLFIGSEPIPAVFGGLPVAAARKAGSNSPATAREGGGVVPALP